MDRRYWIASRINVSGSIARVVAQRPALQGTLQVVGCIGVAGAALAALTGSWRLGLALGALGTWALWLGGVLLLPRSTEAYKRRVRSAMIDWQLEAGQSWWSRARHRPELIAQLAGLDVPPGYAERHRLIVDELTTALREPAEQELGERVAQALERWDRIDSWRSESGRAGSPDEARRFWQDVDPLLEAWWATYSSASAAAELSCDRAVRRLTSIRPPRNLVERHAKLIDAVTAYADGQERLNAAIVNKRTEQAKDAGAALEGARREVEERSSELLAPDSE